MAKSLDERYTSAIAPGSRLSDCETLVLDLHDEQRRLSERIAHLASQGQDDDAELEAQEAAIRVRRIDQWTYRLAQAILLKRRTAEEKERLRREGQEAWRARQRMA